MKKVLITLLVVLMVLSLVGCKPPPVGPSNGDPIDPGGDLVGPTDPNGQGDVVLPGSFVPGFPVHSEVVKMHDLSVPGVFNNFVFESEAGVEDIRTFFIQELRSQGWYATSLCYSQFTEGTAANDIYAINPSDENENWFIIIVYENSSDYDEDGYAVQFTEMTQPGGIPFRPDVVADIYEDIPIYPGSFLASYTDYREQYAASEHFTYHIEVDFWETMNEIEDIFEEYKSMLTEKGWEVSPGVVDTMVDATKGDHKLSVSITDWSMGPVIVGAEIYIISERQ